MKQILPLSLVIILFTFSAIQAQIELPAPSPKGMVYTQVGLTDVEITYFRPKAKGRKIFGEGSNYLVPFGQLWRTGANQGTVVKFSRDVQVGGQNLPSGEYMILTVPGEGSWDLIFYKDPSIGGNMAAFKEEDVQAKVKASVSPRTEYVEALTFNISDLSENGEKANIEITWENTSAKVEILCPFDEIVMAQIEEYTQVDPQNYLASANYYYSSGKDINQALTWINMYFDSNPNNVNQFWNMHLKAEIQAAAGDKKGAIESANKSIEVAKANPGGDFGYIKRNEDLLATLK